MSNQANLPGEDYESRDASDQSEQSGPLYPGVTVKLSGRDGNIGSIMARVRDAFRAAGKDTNVMNELWRQVMEAESYDESLRIIIRYVEVK